MDFTPLPERPVVLVFAGHDPGGGAGVQADIEAIGSLGCHAATLLTALTVQDTRDVRRYVPVPVELLLEQAGLLLADYRIAAVKVGMTGAPETVAAIVSILDRLPGVPVVVDPVLAAGGGTALGGDALRSALRAQLLPRATLATPNTPEARALAPEADTPAACAQELLAGGCTHVLVTGGHDAGTEVISTLYGNHRVIARHAWPRLPGEFHGSGCTLASACAALLAHGADIASAVDEALAYTWHALGNARRPGQGQSVPDRFFRAQGKRWQRGN